MPSRSRRVLLPIIVMLGCSTEPSSQLPQGQWNSPDVLFTVGDGRGVLNLSCRDAVIPPAIPLTRDGDFKEAITIEEFGAVYRTYPAVLSGHLTLPSLRMTIEVSSERGKETYDLRPGRGEAPARCG